MPQLSLYLDDNTLQMVKEVAALSNTSVSKWVRNKVLQSLHNEWPDGYFQLYGTVNDKSFAEPSEPYRINDTPREEL